MPVITFEIACPSCGAANQRRETIAGEGDWIVAPVEVVWCSECRMEIPPGTHVLRGES